VLVAILDAMEQHSPGTRPASYVDNLAVNRVDRPRGRDDETLLAGESPDSQVSRPREPGPESVGDAKAPSHVA